MKSLWQRTDWQAFQEARGLKTELIQLQKQDLLATIYPLVGGYEYAYFSRIPQLDGSELTAFLDEVQKHAQDKKWIFTRYDSYEQMKPPKGFKLRDSHSIQPEETLLLDLKLSKEELLAQMKRKGRYNIGLAEKKGVQVESFSSKDKNQLKSGVQRFYQILQETTSRDGFSGHDEQYYFSFLSLLKGAELLIAHDGAGQDLAGLITVPSGKRMVYYYGASGNHKRELMAPYLLQWKAMLEAKKSGFDHYDLFGVAPKGAESDHPWAGITSFKEKFGGKHHHSPPAKELVHRPLLYQLFKGLKKLQSLKRMLSLAGKR